MINLGDLNWFQRICVYLSLPNFYKINIIIGIALSILSGIFFHRSGLFLIDWLYWDAIIDFLMGAWILIIALKQVKDAFDKYFVYRYMKETGRESELEIKYK